MLSHCALLLIATGNDQPRSKVAGGMPIEAVLSDLLETYTGLGVGWEKVPLTDDRVDGYQAPTPAEPQAAAIARVSAMLERHTDYTCIYANNWLVIAPKERPERNNKPVVLRTCRYSAAKDTPWYAVLASVTGISGQESIALNGNRNSAFPPHISGNVTLVPATSRCSDLLCKLADQLFIRHWQVTHMFLTHYPGTLERPIDLRRGLVRFSIPSQATPPPPATGIQAP